ncbi:MAG: hypothetical protein IJS34_00735 [Alphaproteobacteria bacterium]|nr:hypothetical protein [Alphaproteobacteria bacterium]
MKTMKTTVPYNFKKVLTGIMLVAVPVFVACEKDPVKPNNNGGNGGNTQQKHNVELKYGRSPSTQWQNISMDTLYKYNSDPTVDSIFMIPEDVAQFANLNDVQIQTVLTPKLRERHNVNPHKVFGKGDLKLNSVVLDQCPEIVRFFADTLKYNVR